ncbi:MAG TPA: hypothetical protein DCL41_00535 [Bdellovibrionales bacterium]|nr:hypothetical protein [Bdellovibrionales bacterium]|tara:strand:+ start:9754 stop:10323 length:570 start_codon:yes stop_codon:yes gene_type:complete
MKDLKNSTVVVSAASLILAGFSGMLAAEMTQNNNHLNNPSSFDLTNSEGDLRPFLPIAKNDRVSWDQNPTENQSWRSNGELVAMAQADMSIRDAQRSLRDLGYELDVDGVSGPQTKSAIRDFQAANGIAQSARLDAATISALRDASQVEMDMNDDRFPASFDDQEADPYDSNLPAFPEFLERDGTQPVR